MPYNNNIIETFENAKNFSGTMNENDPNVGVGLVGAPACGDVMMFFIKILDGNVVDACFQTFGCGSAISSSALLVEKVIGRTLQETMAIKNKDIYDELKLPPVKYHCSVLAEEAVKAAVENWKSKQNNNNNNNCDDENVYNTNNDVI